jgi:hypothetical protein
MIRIILGVVIGFFAWMAVWVGSERLLSALAPDWFGVHQTAYENAVINSEPFTVATSILFVNLFRGIVITLLAGYLAALVSGESRVAPALAGIILLAVGIWVASVTWNMSPLWYHTLFTLMFVPAAIAGGLLRRRDHSA